MLARDAAKTVSELVRACGTCEVFELRSIAIFVFEGKLKSSLVYSRYILLHYIAPFPLLYLILSLVAYILSSSFCVFRFKTGTCLYDCVITSLCGAGMRLRQ